MIGKETARIRGVVMALTMKHVVTKFMGIFERKIGGVKDGIVRLESSELLAKHAFHSRGYRFAIIARVS